MNKTVNINISGMVFHIEEDAYEVLKSYMHEIKTYFSRSAEDTEVVTDIENRIAEMFSERLKENNREVIVLSDVEGIIAQIGRVSDFEDASEEEEIPPRKKTPKRLFRDTEDKKLGGVCSGISHYFGWDPVWLRLVTVILTIVTSGFGLLVYIIFWLIMPPAETLGEKMAMKGEQFHLSNFRKTFDETVNSAKESFESIRSEFGKPENANSVKRFLNEIMDALAGLIRGIGKIILPILAVLLIACGVLWLVSTIVGLVGFAGFSEGNLLAEFPMNMVESHQQKGFLISALAAIGIPAIAIILLGTRLLLKRRTMSAPIGLGLLAAWLIAVGFTAYYSASTASNFRQGASMRQIKELAPVENATWYLEMDEYVSNNSRSVDSLSSRTQVMQRNSVIGLDQLDRLEDVEDWDRWDEDLYEVDLRIEQSNTGKAALVQVFNARGKDFNDAVNNTESIRYGFEQENGVLRFGRYFSLKENSLWRGQEVDLSLQLPAGSRVVIDDKLRYMLENHELWAEGQRHEKNWIVTAEGLQPQLKAESLQPQVKADTLNH